MNDEELIAALRVDVPFALFNGTEADWDEAEKKLMAAADRLEALTEECFALAANQCSAGYGDEYGNHRCRHEDAARALTQPSGKVSDEERRRRAAGPSSVKWPMQDPLAKYKALGITSEGEAVVSVYGDFTPISVGASSGPQPAHPDLERYELTAYEGGLYMKIASEGSWTHYDDAQAHIAALTAKVKELTKLVSDSEKERYRVCGELLGRAETAEARVAQCQEALERIGGTASKTSGHGAGKWHNICLEIARAALGGQSNG